MISSAASRAGCPVSFSAATVLLGGKGQKGHSVSASRASTPVSSRNTTHCRLDVLLIPPIRGLGTAVIDAMALGTPPIAFAVGGLPEVIEDGKSGLLIPPGDVQAFMRGAAELITNDALRARLGAGAGLRAKEFSVERMIERTAEVYHRVIAG